MPDTMPQAKKIAVLLRHSPYGNSLAHEALDAILAAAAYEQQLSVIFMADGVFQLLKSQDSASVGQKSIEKKIAALELYGIEDLYVSQESLNKRQLKAEDLPQGLKILSQTCLNQLIRQQDSLLSF